MPANIPELWEQAVTEKQTDLRYAFNKGSTSRRFEELIALDGLDDFEQTLGHLCDEYETRGDIEFVRDKLQPQLETVKQICLAFQNVTQSSIIASATLGAVLVVIYCGVEFAKQLDAIFQQHEQLLALIPERLFDFKIYSRPELSQRLQIPLLDIFKDYLDFCIIVVKWSRHSIFGAYKQKIIAVQRSLKKHTTKFDAVVQHIGREQVNFLTDQATKRLPPPVRFPQFNALHQNKYFIGRDQELKALRENLLSDSVNGIGRLTCCAISGVAGVGKTDTAVEFCHRNRHEYEAVFWISAESDFTIKSGFSEISQRLNLCDYDQSAGSNNFDSQREILLVKEWLENSGKTWLLVFDNIAEFRDIRQYWPSEASKRGSIIVTTQLKLLKKDSWADHHVFLNLLDPEQGSKVLFNYLDRDVSFDHPDRVLGKKVSEMHGGLPLFIALAAENIDGNEQPLASWIKENEGRYLRLDQYHDGRAWNYDRAPTGIFDEPLKRLKQDSRDFLFMLAFLSPDHIHEGLLVADHEFRELSMLHARNRPRYRSMVREISRRFGVKSEPANGQQTGKSLLRIHRITQHILLNILEQDPDFKSNTFDRVVKLLRSNYPKLDKLMRPSTQRSHLTLDVLPHILHLSEVFGLLQPPVKGTRQFAELLVDVGGMDLYDQGYMRETLAILDVAESVLNDLNVEEDDIYRGNILTVRGMCGDILGISMRTEILKVRERCRDIRQQRFQQLAPAARDIDEEVLLYNSFMDLACSLQHLNRFDAVADICKDCLSQYNRWGSEKDPTQAYEYAKYYNHMAYVWLYRGDDERARQYARKGYEFMSSRDADAQMTMLFHFDWACILFQTGCVDEAILQHEMVLQQRTESLGSENIRTMESHMNLGIIYLLSENFAQAESHLTIARDQTVSDGWPQENTLRVKYYLGQLWISSSSRVSEGKQLQKESIAEASTLAHNAQTKDPVDGLSEELLIDWVVAWELRLITPRKQQLEAGVRVARCPPYFLATSLLALFFVGASSLAFAFS